MLTWRFKLELTDGSVFFFWEQQVLVLDILFPLPHPRIEKYLIASGLNKTCTV